LDRLVAAKRTAKRLIRPVGDHLVRVGVRRGCGTGLKDVDDKVFVEFAFLDLFGGLLDGVRQPRLEQTEFAVDQGGCALNLRQRPDESAWQAQPADRKILTGALRARTVVRA